MNILFVTSSAELGGAEWSLLDLIWSLKQERSDWSFEILLPAPGPMSDKAEDLGVRCSVIQAPRLVAQMGDAAAGSRAGNRHHLVGTLARLGLAAPGALGYLYRLRSHLRKRSPTLVHANGFKAQVLSSLCAPAGVPVLWHMHDYLGDRPISVRLLRALRSRCSAVVANSASVADDVRTRLGRAVPVQVLHNAVDLESFHPAGATLDLDALAGLDAPSEQVIRVGLLATFARWKGHETFLRALALLTRNDCVRGYIIGGPVYRTAGSQYAREELETIAQGLGLTGRIGFTGFVHDRAAALRSLDIVVHASTAPEPFGLVIVEAMACGRAVIVSAGGGAVEIVNAGTDAVLHAPGDAAALAARIVELARNVPFRRALGIAGRRSAVARFDRRRLAAGITARYIAVTSFGHRGNWS